MQIVLFFFAKLQLLIVWYNHYENSKYFRNLSYVIGGLIRDIGVSVLGACIVEYATNSTYSAFTATLGIMMITSGLIMKIKKD